MYSKLTYLTPCLCKPEHAMGELLKKASKEAYDKDMRGYMHSIDNIILRKHEVSTHEAIKKLLNPGFVRKGSMK